MSLTTILILSLFPLPHHSPGTQHYSARGVGRTHHRDKNSAQNIAQIFFFLLECQQMPFWARRTTRPEDLGCGREYSYTCAELACGEHFSFVRALRRCHKSVGGDNQPAGVLPDSDSA